MKTIELEFPRPEVAIPRLARPESLNALSWELTREHEALDELDANNRCRIAILTGAGRAFCAGLEDELCDFTPFGVFATKQMMWAHLDVGSLEVGIQLENRNQIMAGSSGETREAAAAFFEKRKPRWSEHS